MQATTIFCIVYFVSVCTCSYLNRRSTYGHGDRHESGNQRSARSPSDDSSTRCSEVVSPVPPEIATTIRQKRFYNKVVTVYGIPIMSSSAVDNRALQRACYTVRFMLAGSTRLRLGMKVGKARVAIIGRNEKIYQVPEYARYSRRRSWANRRGVGGTIYKPVTVAPEENLLCEDNDTYSSNGTCGQDHDVLIHELSHAIHLIACYEQLPFFDERLYSAYKKALAADLWQNTYSAINHKEYFAMGVLAYLNELREDPLQCDRAHNHIKTRAELMMYDRDLYNMVEEILPCPNNFISRSNDLDQNRSSSQVLQMDCHGQLPDYSDYNCEDNIRGCEDLLPRCQTQVFVVINCKKSCNKC